METNAPNLDRMYTDIEWALSQGLPLGQLVPMVERLMKQAEPQSLHQLYAKRQLAELIVRKEPFRAARLAQDVLLVHPEDDRAHAVLGLSCLMMGHFRKAERAYRTALSLVPHCPWYAHNLGHLLDVVMDKPKEAEHWLLLARRSLPHEPEIATSYAHALLRLGRTSEARQELLLAFDGDVDEVEARLSAWMSAV